MPEDVHMLAYADDLAVLVKAKNKEQLKWKGNEALRQIGYWMEKHELELAPHKSEAVILKGQRRRGDISFICGDVEILPKKSVEYLGIVISENCHFGNHIKLSIKKAESKVAAISRITPNIRGPGSKKREMLCNVVQSILLYGAPIWCDYLKIKKYKQLVTSVQRKMLLRVTSAYRTVSARAVQVIAGIIPIELLAEERKALYQRIDGTTQHAKLEERTNTFLKWQELWNQTETVAQWTKKLIPNLKEWVECNHRRTDYFLTQVFSGHGSFKYYTKRIAKTEVDTCIYCGLVDTTEHTIFKCRRWNPQRELLYRELGTILSPDNLVPNMLHNPKRWNQIASFLRQTKRNKENEERQFRAGGPIHLTCMH